MLYEVITCILSGAEMLGNQLQGRFSQGELQVLNIIFQGGKRLESIVEDLLEVAKIESQSIYLARETVHLPTLLKDIGTDYHPRITSYNVCYTKLLRPLEQEMMRTHAVKGRQIIDAMIKAFDFESFSHINILRHIAEYHHECLDGSGYPWGLRCDEIVITSYSIHYTKLYE